MGTAPGKVTNADLAKNTKPRAHMGPLYVEDFIGPGFINATPNTPGGQNTAIIYPLYVDLF
ncbi:MAG: hypothetical protein ABI416_11660 [Ginsengibacter sp.]